MPRDLTSKRTDPFDGKDIAFLSSISAAGFAVGMSGIRHFGYMGQDFISHRTLVLTFPSSFGFGLTNPPGLYAFGSAIRRLVGGSHYLEVIALAFLILNAWALWIVYRFLWMSMARWQLRYAAAALATFIPFRVIHSVVLAADAFTLPFFALGAVFVLNLFENPKDARSWIAMSVCLSGGMVCKYTFAGLLPPAALILAMATWRKVAPGERLRWGLAGAAALSVPIGVFLFEMRASAHDKGSVTDQQWLTKGAPSVMRWRDQLLPQRSDLRLLRAAPEYEKDRLYGFREFSYLGLIHSSSFVDVLNFFQPPPSGVATDWGHRTQDPFPRTRTDLSQELQTFSVRWSLPFSVLALTGTIAIIVLTLRSLQSGESLVPEAVMVMTSLASGFYSTVFFSLHRINDPYTAGFWLPRLVLPALLIFFCLGFVFLDLLFRHVAVRRQILDPCLSLFLGYTLVACGFFAGFLA